jgi:hypothetical protein
MPITFYVKVSMDAKEGSLKKQLSPFKQVFNLLDEFKELFDSETNKFVAPPPKSPRSEPGGELEEALQKAESSGKKKRSKKDKSLLNISPQRQRFMAHILDDHQL